MLFTLLKEQSCCEQKQETAVWVGPMNGVKDDGEQPDDDASLVRSDRWTATSRQTSSQIFRTSYADLIPPFIDDPKRGKRNHFLASRRGIVSIMGYCHRIILNLKKGK